MKSLIIIAALIGAVAAHAEAPKIYAADGTYLGTLSDNKYDPESTSNPYGQYGSKYAPDSINNPYGRYGSEYSQDSPNNPYAPSSRRESGLGKSSDNGEGGGD